MHRLAWLFVLAGWLLAPHAAAAAEASCTPAAYGDVEVERSLRACEAYVADRRNSPAHRIQAYNNMGDLLLRKGDHEASLRSYNKGIELLKTQKIVPAGGWGSPPPPAGSIDSISAASVYNGRAWLHVNRKDHARAVEDYTASLKIHPNSIDILSSRADSYAELGQLQLALADLNQAIAYPQSHGTTPYARDYAERGTLLLKTGEFDRALADLNRAIELEPGHREAMVSRSKVYLAKGQLDLALADLDKLIASNSTVSDTRNTRGLVYVQKGDFERALVEFNEAITYAPSDHPHERAKYYANRAAIHRERHDWLKAIEDYQSALTYDPSNAVAVEGRDAARLVLSTPAPAPATAPAPQEKSAIANERRVALVVGNAAYQSVAELPNPRRDAEAVARTLRASGFQVVQLATDLTRSGLVQSLQAFATESDRADWAVVYFAGHGMEVGGSNYLIPVDATLRSDRDVPLEAVALDQVLASIEGARKLRLVVLDACRDNPFVNKMARSVAGRSVGRGLARVEPEGATLVAYSARHGQIALDGGPGGNSPFVTALIKHLQSPNLEISKMFRLVRDDVLAATGNQQEPFTYGSLPGSDFFFRVQ